MNDTSTARGGLVLLLCLTISGGVGAQDAIWDRDLAIDPDQQDAMLSAGELSNKLRNFHNDQRISGQYIVVLNEDYFFHEEKSGDPLRLKAAVKREADLLTRNYAGKVSQHYTAALKGFVVSGLSEGQVREMAKDPLVDYIEADTVVSLNRTQNNPTWGLDRSDERSLPLDRKYVYGSTAGNGVNVYVIDTGIRTGHNDFGGRAFEAATAISDGRGAQDCNGHGTHVAGTVGGNRYGIAKRVRLYAVRVLGCNGSGSNSGVIAGIDWVANNRRLPAVANMSLGGGFSSATNRAVRNAHNRGVVMVVAAGNENQNACNVSPASESRAITVGATTSSDSRSSFSNYGSCLDIFAPGSSITSAWYNSNSATRTISGTSMASPHVAGAAAVYLGRNRSASPNTVANWLINRSTKNRVGNARSGSPNRLLYLRY